jgi:S1-C subfamily serine protease
VAAGFAQDFTATGTYEDGRTADVSADVTWASDDTAVATVDAAGVATGIAAGSADISATIDTISGSGTLTVTAAVLEAIEVAPAPALPGERLARQRLGLRLKPITQLLAERAGLEAAVGVLVVRAEKNGPGDRAGLQAGDVLLRVGLPVLVAPGRMRWSLSEIRSLDDLGQFLSQVKPDDRVLVQVVREGREMRGELVAR